MLKFLHIQNFAIIDQVELEFGGGLNIISGETGAGKSIIMDALFLILGGRASSELIRSGSDEATVEAIFDLKGSPEIETLLSDLSIDNEQDELIVRRVVHRSGKNRIFLNGSLATMGTLQALTASLVDMCSQHDQQLLAKPEQQLFWIDRFASLESQRSLVRKFFSSWKEKKVSLDALLTNSSQRTQRIDFLRFQLQELVDAQLSGPTEDADLEAELKVLANSENLYAFASEAETAIYGSDQSEQPSIQGQVVSLLQKSKTLSQEDAKLTSATEFLQSMKVNLDELAFFLRTYTQGIARDEGRVDHLNARLAQLAKLKRKYGSSLADVLEAKEQIAKELSQLENHDISLQDANNTLNFSLEQYKKAADTLSKSRQKEAKTFCTTVVKELADLQMPRSRFEISFENSENPTANGHDQVQFLFAANPGEAIAPLNRVASGGELSRIMLAMHNVVSSIGGVGVYLFDEVDTGIGGKTAVTVGAKLQKVASHNQVICITHLPQVAAFADQHFHVSKEVVKKGKEERTVCKVIALATKERESEIARMLGGMGNDKAALANARSLIDGARASALQ